MIRASTSAGFYDLLNRLTAKAQALAEAKAAGDALARRANPLRWRRAALVWPLFAKG